MMETRFLDLIAPNLIRRKPLKHDKSAYPARVVYPITRPYRRRRPVTVCIAAICTWAAQPPLAPQLMIVGSSDRLLTVGDIEFEPDQLKLYQFTTHIVALTAGDSHAQIAICDATRLHFISQAPSSVEEVANTYAVELAAYRRRQAEFRYLQPLGLNQESFITRQNELSPSLVNALATDLERAYLEIETIITGADATGYHIFVITDPGITRCSDSVAFAAIGIGQRHAESTFMFQRYSRSFSYPRALLLTYAAKSVLKSRQASEPRRIFSLSELMDSKLLERRFSTK